MKGSGGYDITLGQLDEYLVVSDEFRKEYYTEPSGDEQARRLNMQFLLLCLSTMMPPQGPAICDVIVVDTDDLATDHKASYLVLKPRMHFLMAGSSGGGCAARRIPVKDRDLKDVVKD